MIGEDELTVEYVDSETNYYDVRRKSIILDYRLNKYPKLRKQVVEHEKKHHEIFESDNHLLVKTCLNLWHDLKTDFKRNFELFSDELVKQEKKYFEELDFEKTQYFWQLTGNIFGNAVRALVYLPLLITGSTSMRIKHEVRRRL